MTGIEKRIIRFFSSYYAIYTKKYTARRQIKKTVIWQHDFLVSKSVLYPDDGLKKAAVFLFVNEIHGGCVEVSYESSAARKEVAAMHDTIVRHNSTSGMSLKKAILLH